MGAKLYRIGESKRFLFQDKDCLSASCFDPGSFINVRNGRQVFCCEHRATHGCPDARGHATANAIKRKGEGWREDETP